MDESTKFSNNSLDATSETNLNHEEKTASANLFDNDKTILAEYTPVPYIFVLKDIFHKDVHLPLWKLQTSRCECPPFHVLVDHLMAVLWSFYSKRWHHLLQTSQLHWALKILENVKDCHGKHTEDVSMAINHLYGAYIDVCSYVDIETLQERKQRSWSFIESSNTEVAYSGILKKNQNETENIKKESSDKTEESKSDSDEVGKTAELGLESTKIEQAPNLESEQVQIDTSENTKTASQDNSLDYDMFEIQLLKRKKLNETKKKVDKPKAIASSPSIHLRDMLEKEPDYVFESLMNPPEEEGLCLEDVTPANRSKPQVELTLAERDEKDEVVASLKEEIRKMNETLEELKKTLSACLVPKSNL